MGAGSRFLTNPKRFNAISVTEFANALLATWQTAGSHYKHAATFGMESISYEPFLLADWKLTLCSKVLP